MTSVVADTHSLIWYLLEPNKLSDNALNALDQAGNEGNFIYVSAISIIEINYLIEKRRLPEIVLQRIVEVISDVDAILNVTSVDLNISLILKQINREYVSDMPDRIIAATALYLSIPLVTRDAKIKALSNIQTIW
jgi:PIN domain nuclease of toxin-antitoxin system